MGAVPQLDACRAMPVSLLSQRLLVPMRCTPHISGVSEVLRSRRLSVRPHIWASGRVQKMP